MLAKYRILRVICIVLSFLIQQCDKNKNCTNHSKFGIKIDFSIKNYVSYKVSSTYWFYQSLYHSNVFALERQKCCLIKSSYFKMCFKFTHRKLSFDRRWCWSWLHWISVVISICAEIKLYIKSWTYNCILSILTKKLLSMYSA